MSSAGANTDESQKQNTPSTFQPDQQPSMSSHLPSPPQSTMPSSDLTVGELQDRLNQDKHAFMMAILPMLWGDRNASIGTAFSKYPEFAAHVERGLLELREKLPPLGQQTAPSSIPQPMSSTIQPPLQQPQPQRPALNAINKLQATTASPTNIAKPTTKANSISTVQPATDPASTPSPNATDTTLQSALSNLLAPNPQSSASSASAPSPYDGYALASESLATFEGGADVGSVGVLNTVKDVLEFGGQAYDWNREHPLPDDYCINCNQLKTARPSALAARLAAHAAPQQASSKRSREEADLGDNEVVYMGKKARTATNAPSSTISNTHLEAQGARTISPARKQSRGSTSGPAFLPKQQTSSTPNRLDLTSPVNQPQKSTRRSRAAPDEDAKSSDTTRSWHPGPNGEPLRGPTEQDPFKHLPSYTPLLEAFGAFSDGTEPTMTRDDVCEYVVQRHEEGRPKYTDSGYQLEIKSCANQLVKKRAQAIDGFLNDIDSKAFNTAGLAACHEAIEDFWQWMKEEVNGKPKNFKPNGRLRKCLPPTELAKQDAAFQQVKAVQAALRPDEPSVRHERFPQLRIPRWMESNPKRPASAPVSTADQSAQHGGELNRPTKRRASHEQLPTQKRPRTASDDDLRRQALHHNANSLSRNSHVQQSYPTSSISLQQHVAPASVSDLSASSSAGSGMSVPSSSPYTYPLSGYNPRRSTGNCDPEYGSACGHHATGAYQQGQGASSVGSTLPSYTGGYGYQQTHLPRAAVGSYGSNTMPASPPALYDPFSPTGFLLSPASGRSEQPQRKQHAVRAPEADASSSTIADWNTWS